MTTRERLAAVYAKIPAIACRRKCQAYCGLIPFTVAERTQMRRHARPENPPRKDALLCPSLDVGFGTCSVYPDRPLICRLWGVTERLRCPHGCEPERILSDAEAVALTREIYDIGGAAEVFVGDDTKAAATMNRMLAEARAENRL